MNSKCVFLFLFSFCVLHIIEPAPSSYKKLTTKELNTIALKCIDEVNIDKSVIEEVLRTQVLPQDHKKYKKYLACSYKKQGFLTPDGTKMIYENLYTFLEDFYTSSELENLNHCEKITEEDPGELCFQNLQCILTGLRKIEEINGLDIDNHIDSHTTQD